MSGVAYARTAPGTYYAATARSGVWKTTDAGRTWRPLSDTWPTLQTSSVAVDLRNANIVYVGTGDFDQSYGRFRNTYGFGIMKSTDGGATWRNLGNGQLRGFAIRKILIDPEDSNLVTVTAGRSPYFPGAVWRSANGGVDWGKALDVPADWCNVVAGLTDAQGKRAYYAVGLSGSRGQVWLSEDRGLNWTPITLPISSDPNVEYFGLDVAPSAVEPHVLYLLAGTDHKLFRSIDRGQSWGETTGDFPGAFPFYPSATDLNWRQANYDWHIECAPGAGGDDVVYVGLVDLDVSTDSGLSWQSAAKGYSSGALTHVDHHCLAFNPSNPNEALVGHDGGIARMTYSPAAHTWSFDNSLNRALGTALLYHGAFHPTDPTRMLAGAQDNNSPASLGDLANWRALIGGDGGACAINSVDPNLQYGTVQLLGVVRTSDQWTTSQDISPPYPNTETTAFIAPIALDPRSPGRLYAGTNYLWRWDEATFSWTPRLGGQVLGETAPRRGITCIAVAPGDSNRIYTGSSDGQVWMSANAGSTWTRINGGSPALPTRWITDIVVQPSSASSILVTISGTGSGHVWQCTNTTANPRVWKDVSGPYGSGLPDVPVNTVALDPNAPASTWYVGTDVGVFYTSNSGGAWTNATAPLGLPNVEVDQLTVVPGTGSLMAVTYGRGIWSVPITGAAVTYAVRGRVTLDGHAMGGVTVRAGAASVRTLGDGTYEFRGLAAGTYTVTPSQSGYVFTPASASVRVGPDVNGVNFTAAVQTFSIGGTIRFGTSAVAGALVSATGPGVATVTQSVSPALAIPDANQTGVTSSLQVSTAGSLASVKVAVNITHPFRGDLQLTLVHPDGTQVRLFGPSFDPTDNLVTLFPDQTTPAQSLSALNNKPAAGTWKLLAKDLYGGDTGTLNSWGLTLGTPGTVTRTVTTASTGAYTVSGLTAGAFTMAATKPGLSLSPSGYTNPVRVGPSKTGVNFSATRAYSISGLITYNGAVLPGVTVSGGGKTATTGPNGGYTLDTLLPGSYTVTPSKAGYVFTPANRSVSITSANVTGVSFSAAGIYSIAGTVTAGTAPLAGTTVSAGGRSTTTGTNGAYTLAGLPPGTYTVTPAKTGYGFNPRNRSVSLTTASVGGVSFGAVSLPAPRADYRFQNTLASSVGSPPALQNLGSNVFATEIVDGQSRRVLQFPQGSGLSLSPTSGVIPDAVHSTVVLFRFHTVSSYRRILDWKNAATDNGLYSLNGALRFYNYASGSAAPVQVDRYVQVVLTRDSGKAVVAYADGGQQFAFTDTNDEAVLSSAVLRFFQDNGNLEASAGAVARIRLYDVVLTPAQVAALDW